MIWIVGYIGAFLILYLGVAIVFGITPILKAILKLIVKIVDKIIYLIYN